MTLLEVARIIKPHGLSGEVVVQLVTNRLERLDAGSVLSIRSHNGAPVVVCGKALTSLTVTHARPHQNRFLVQFESVSGRNDAEALRDVVLLAEPIDVPDALFVHDLIGKHVVERSGLDRGIVTGFEANPASDLLVVDNQHYVPVRFVVENGATIVIDPPEGLFS